MNPVRRALDQSNMRTVDLYRGLQGLGVTITLSAVQQWTGGQTKPRAELLGRIADLLGLQPAEVIGWYRDNGAPLPRSIQALIGQGEP